MCRLCQGLFWVVETIHRLHRFTQIMTGRFGTFLFTTKRTKATKEEEKNNALEEMPSPFLISFPSCTLVITHIFSVL